MTSLNLPVLDISDSDYDTAKSLVDAVSTYGFVYVKNDGQTIPPDGIDSMFDLARRFFQSPVNEKAKCAVNSKESGKNSGWFAINVEKLDPAHQRIGDFKECFNMNEFRHGKAQQPLPPVLSQSESQVNSFVNQCHSLCLRILNLFAIGLGIEPSAGGSQWFSRHHDKSLGPSGSVFRLLYYPKMDLGPDFDSDKDIRAGAHSDYGTITLLFQRQGQPGLEILTDESIDAWQSVPVNPTKEPNLPILVNVGDLLSYWTNGLFKSTVHRVVFPNHGSGEDRYSMAYFCHPLDSARLEPVPSSMVNDFDRVPGPSRRIEKGAAMTAKEHLESRLNATYV